METITTTTTSCSSTTSSMPPSAPPNPSTMTKETRSRKKAPKTGKGSTYCFQAKKWFLTFPQCSLPHQQALENLQSKFQPIDWAIVAEEKPQDGTPHLHIAIQFKDRFYSSDMRAFDPICGQHGNYQPMKNIRNTVAYVTKEGEYTAFGIDVKAVLEKKCGTFTIMAKELQSGKTIDDLNQINPGFVMQHKRKLEEYESWVQKRNERAKKKKWTKFTTADIEDLNTVAEMKIAAWLNLNICEPREFRQEQLYVHGPPKMGKSTLIRRLEEYLNIYYVPRDDGEFCDQYEDGVYDLIVLDEFTNKKTMQWMNQLLDGQTCYLKRKGGQILKRNNLPVIVLSNFTLEQNYPRLYEAGMLEPLISRFRIIEVKEMIVLFQ